jgi:hypothetical protein
MLDLKVTIENDKVVVQGLQNLAARFPGAVKRGLRRSAAGIYSIAFQWLSGPGGAGKKQRSDYTGFTKKSGEAVSFRSFHTSGGYPVPVRTSHLRRQLDWLAPGGSKSGDLGTFKAGDNEVVIFDSALYAPAVFLGRGSSAKFGPRDALKDALEMFNRGAQIQQIIGEEIRKEINQATA